MGRVSRAQRLWTIFVKGAILNSIHYYIIIINEVDGLAMRDKGWLNGGGDNGGERAEGDPGWFTKEPSSLASLYFLSLFFHLFFFSFPCLSRDNFFFLSSFWFLWIKTNR